MTDCICGNPEGTNKECERCRLIAETQRLRTLVMVIESKIAATVDSLRNEVIRLEVYERAVVYLRTEFSVMAMHDQVSLANICRKAPDQICFCGCHISECDSDDYVSPEQQKRNDAMERGGYLRDRKKDERD